MMTIRELDKNNKPEIIALILVCRVFFKTATEEELNNFLGNQEINWTLFYDIVRAHHIRPIVSKVFTDIKINEAVSGRLQSDCMQITLRNFEHYRELIRLGNLFQEAGVTAVPYKGCLFSLQFYNDIGLREFSDLDFLIHPEIKDVHAISKIIVESGYTIGFEAPEKFQEFYFSHIREFKFFLFADNKRKFLAEFHSLLNDPVFETALPIPNEYLFRDLKEEILNGNNIQLLSATKHFIAILTHHGIREQWTSLKNIMDLSMVIRSGSLVDWDSVFECSRMYKFSKVLAVGLQIADDLFGISQGSPYKKVKTTNPWLKKLFSKHLQKPGRTWRNNFALKLRSKDSAGDKYRMLFAHIRHLATPSILDYKFMRLPKPLFFLYAFVKPVRMLKRRVKGDV
jgi:hypothetical protein